MGIDPKTTLRKIEYATTYMKHLTIDGTANAMGIALATAREYHNDPFVKSKIEDYATKMVAQMELTIPEIIVELRKNVELARERNDIKAANEALKMLGTYLKMFKETADAVITDNRRIIVFGGGTALNSSGGPQKGVFAPKEAAALEAAFPSGSSGLEGISELVGEAE